MSTRPPVFLPAPALPTWLDPWLLPRRYRVDTGAWRIHVQERGRGVPIVLVHGNPMWSILWHKVVGHLPTDLRCICPDLLGLGLSDKPRDPAIHTLETHTHVLRTTLEALDLPPCILVVQDWGGPIGVGAFAGALERVRGLVVLNTVLGPPRDGFRSTTFHRAARVPVLSDIAFRGLSFPFPVLHRAQGDPSTLRGISLDAYRYPLRSFRDRVAPLALARMVPDTLEHPSIPALQQVADTVEAWKGPTRIVWGTRDPVLGRALGRVRRALPHAPVLETQAGHFLQEEVPAAIAEAILAVLDASA